MISAPPGRNAFADPATGELYVWQWNHNEEQAGARIRTIENTQPAKARWKTARAIRVQGSRDELVYKLAGKCPTLAQHKAFLHYVDLSMKHTIYFFHAAGEKFECQFSDYEPQRSFVTGPVREPYLFAYSIQLEIVTHL